MRTKWALAGIALLAAILAVGAVACGDDEEDENGGEPPTATAEEVETPQASVAIAPITLAEMDGSGVTGSATITETSAGITEVIVTIDGGLEEGSHINHIHHGTCAAQGEIHQTLTELAAGADGSATATTVVDPAADPANPAYDHWLAREHYVAVHALDASVVACGDVVAATS